MRTLSVAARRAIFAQETAEVFLALLTITDVGIEGNEPLRFVNNTEDIYSRVNGEATPQRYVAFPFEPKLPDERDDQPATPQITIDNVDARILAAIRPLTAPPRLKLWVVLASQPDVIEAGPVEGVVRAVDYDAAQVTANLSGPEVLSERFPGHSFTPAQWPALF